MHEKINAALLRRNGENMKKIIALALALLMFATALVGCVPETPEGPGSETTADGGSGTTGANGDETNDPAGTGEGTGTNSGNTTTGSNGGTTEPDGNKIPAAADDCNLPALPSVSLSVIKDKKTGFKIVYASEMSASADAYSSGVNVYKNLANELKTAITSYYGIGVTVVADKDARSNDRYNEILVGPTDRPESDKAMMFCNGAKGFVVKAVSKKVVINGYTPETTTEAMKYFIDNILAKQASSKTLVFASKDDYVSTPTYTSAKSTIAGYSYKTYTIVVPSNAEYSYMRLARRVQVLIANRIGAIPMIVYDTDGSHNANFEILIGPTKRTSESSKNVGKLEYVVAMNGARVEINGGSLFALEFAGSYLEKNFISDMNSAKYGVKEIVRTDITSALEKKGNKSAKDKAGEVRLIVQNVWGWAEAGTMGIWGCAPIHYNSAQQRNLMMSELYIELDADVIALQEYTDRLLRVGSNYDISPILDEAGYAQVYQASGVVASATPIFYKKDKFELLESNVINLMIPYPGCGGDKYMTIAVLKQKSDGEIFGVISIHKDYRYDAENPDNQAVYDENRFNMANDAIAQAKAIMQKYGSDCPVIVGGDFNCAQGSQPYNAYVADGFVPAAKKAADTDKGGTAIGGPKWNAQKTIFYADFTSYGSGNSSIDHIMVKGSTAGLARYDILTDTFSASISDHLPQVLDFNLN